MLNLPPGCVTGIGSLPMTDPWEAVRFVAEISPHLPFWPQLPQRSALERSLEQALGGVGAHISPRGNDHGYVARAGRLEALVEALRNGPAELDRGDASGLFAFEEAVQEGRFPEAVALKGQIIGPVTMAQYLYADDEPFAAKSDRTEAIAAHVKRLALWQVERLRRLEKPIILFVDEPGLAVVRDRILRDEGRHLLHALTGTLSAIRGAGAVCGLHCCGAFPLALLPEARPDILSFDAYQGLETFFADPDAQAFLRCGGRVAYGLIPVRPSPDDLDPRALFDRWHSAAKRLSGVIDLPTLARHALITASCGLATLDQPAARTPFEKAAEVSSLLTGFIGRSRAR